MQRHQIHLPDKDLAYLREGSRYFDDYFQAVGWAQRYAWINRQHMMEVILRAMRPLLPSFEVSHEAINCHHNYVQKEQHFNAEVYVTRKGAIVRVRVSWALFPVIWEAVLILSEVKATRTRLAPAPMAPAAA